MKNELEVKKWVEDESWYQKIELSNGVVTNGWVSINSRLKYFDYLDFKDKTVLDIGCNSGGQCLWAKKNGAKRVVGYDIDEKRIKQANTLKEIEGLNIDFQVKDLFELDSHDQFDFVFCISVLTEVEDIIGGLKVIKKILRDTAFIEISLAKPAFYLSFSKRWVKGYHTISRGQAVMEIRETKNGYMIDPSLGAVKGIFGSQFDVTKVGKGERYDLVKIKRCSSL